MQIGILIKLSIPKSGLSQGLETFLTWSGVGLTGALVANFLDQQADLAYAAYYTNAVNDAVGYNFWILLAVIGLLLFSLSIPLLYFSPKAPRIQVIDRLLRRLSYTFFLVAFDEGSLMIGILLANLLHTSEKMTLLATKSFLFSNVGLFAILGLMFINAFLWLLGESIYNRDDQYCSGLVNLLLKVPLKYLAPLYLSFTGIGLYLLVYQ
ncbi:MxaP protein [Methylomonas paludis]|uniref:MxaP protein n=1 Tax=Methylomonas paludis TaxID=1173101 RepID=A0A975MML7_9GAMM|nr:MxaP protein [Methylomonas paludis]QWF70149.1 MxaP protein [Methylomonas paludis]